MTRSKLRTALAVTLALVLLGGLTYTAVGVLRGPGTHVTAYFDNTTGLYPGDQVRILGVPVGKIDTITPGPTSSKVTFFVDRKYRIPADANAIILSPALVSARVLQLTPAYTTGPVLEDGAVIPQERTALPVEWDDLRTQIAKLTESLQPSSPGGTSPAGEFINTGANNLRGQGATIRDALADASKAFSALGDHSTDLFSTVKQLSLLVSALRSSSDVMAQLNVNFAEVTRLLSENPRRISDAITNLDTAVSDVQRFVADNRETASISVDKLASITTAVTQSMDSIKQGLHVAPNTLANFTNTYYPSTGSVAALTVLPHFANPLQYICGNIQAASRLNYEQSAKLCVQYLAPILKNRQYNFPPVSSSAALASIPVPIPLPGPVLPLPFPPYLLPTLLTSVAPIPIPVTGAMARPNEITYSEDRLRPDYRPQPQAPAVQPPLPAEVATPENLQDMMIPPTGGN